MINHILSWPHVLFLYLNLRCFFFSYSEAPVYIINVDSPNLWASSAEPCNIFYHSLKHENLITCHSPILYYFLRFVYFVFYYKVFSLDVSFFYFLLKLFLITWFNFSFRFTSNFMFNFVC